MCARRKPILQTSETKNIPVRKKYVVKCLSNFFWLEIRKRKGSMEKYTRNNHNKNTQIFFLLFFLKDVRFFFWRRLPSQNEPILTFFLGNFPNFTGIFSLSFSYFLGLVYPNGWAKGKKIFWKIYIFCFCLDMGCCAKLEKVSTQRHVNVLFKRYL